MSERQSIYVVRNVNGGKCYVGQTDRGFRERWGEHVRDSRTRPKTYFHKAIRKHGPQSFVPAGSIELGPHIAASDADAMNKIEKLLIARLKTGGKDLYNLTEGGDNGELAPEAKKRLGRRTAAANRRRMKEKMSTPAGRAAVRRRMKQVFNLPQSKAARRRNFVLQQQNKTGLFGLSKSGRLARSLKANHNRWHVKRNRPNPLCEFCNGEQTCRGKFED